MRKLKYLIKRIFSMDYSSMIKSAKRISRKSGKLFISVFFDMIICGFRHGAGYVDYEVFEMYDLNEAQRKTYVTRGRSNALVVKYNSREDFHFIDNKSDFNTRYADFLGRRWIVIDKTGREDALSWIEQFDEFIAKTTDGMCGKGIKKIVRSEYESDESLYDYLLENKYTVLEEIVVQCREMSELNPSSVNTVRIVTVLSGGKVHCVCAFLRMGNGKFVDNLNSGGLAVKINVLEGKVEHDATDKDGKVFSSHPSTGVMINGFVIPQWSECLELARKGALVTPSVGYIGWDVAITDDGPLFIEANPFPGHDLYQLPAYTDDKTGMMPLFEAID